MLLRTNEKTNDLLLLGKQIIFDESEVLFDFTASKLTKQHQKLEDYFKVMAGKWYLDGDYLIGEEPKIKVVLFTLIHLLKEISL